MYLRLPQAEAHVGSQNRSSSLHVKIRKSFGLVRLHLPFTVDVSSTSTCVRHVHDRPLSVMLEMRNIESSPHAWFDDAILQA